ncbi:MAG: NUDIX domain-containing protein [Actinomycetaceae bacterium]|nr:NUDIX domain-containing protein [Actinomycetaceae bacterium]
MSIPPFIVELRKHIGTAELWLSGVTAVVTNTERTHVLLVKRSDNGQWTPITGIIDPREQPAVTAMREAKEEANITIRIERLLGVDVVGPVAYDNGDTTSYLDIAFHATYRSGDPYPADGENTEVKWFPVTDLPPLNNRFAGCVERALSDEERAYFEI